MQYTRTRSSVFIPAVLVACAASLVGQTSSVVEQRPKAGENVAEILRDLHSAATVERAAEIQTFIRTLMADRGAFGTDSPSYLHISTEIAVLQFRVGHIEDAERTISDVLNSGAAHRMSNSSDVGLNHFMLASIRTMRADFASAEREYRLALGILKRIGPSQNTAVARVYSDMAIMYMRTNDFRSAEICLKNSLGAESGPGAAAPAEVFLRRDTILHLQYWRGRTTDAAETLRNLFHDYAQNSAIPRYLRAHLYRDSGELSIMTGKYQEAVDRLRLCLSLSDPEMPTPDYALELMTLGDAYSLQNDWADAHQVLQQAWTRSGEFEHNYPSQAGAVGVAYGAVLNREKHFSEARPVLQHALELVQTEPELQVKGINFLIAADHHLHERREERRLRKRLALLEQRPQRDPIRDNTVDVMSFNSQPGR